MNRNNGHNRTKSADKIPDHLRAKISRWLRRARATRGRYFTFFRDYFLIMGKLEALLLQDLINRAEVAEQKGRMDRDQFFRCTTRYLERAGWSHQEQQTYLSRIKNAGFVKAKRRGPSGARWLMIDQLKLEEALDDVIYGDL